MTQEHETEVRDFSVRRKVNSHDIIFMNTSFCFCFIFFNFKKKLSQWDSLFLFLEWVQINGIQYFCNCYCSRIITFIICFVNILILLTTINIYLYITYIIK